MKAFVRSASGSGPVSDNTSEQCDPASLQASAPSPADGRPTELVSDLPWHAVWTRSRHEPLVCSELATKGIETFLPTVTQVSRWSDRKKVIAWPLFPGYCFARFEPDELSKVIRCRGVVAVLSNSGRPIPIPGFEIEALQRMIASGVPYDPCDQLVLGSRVRVVSGPLSGVVGRLDRKGPQDVLILAVELLNSGARIQVSAWDIEPL